MESLATIANDFLVFFSFGFSPSNLWASINNVVVIIVTIMVAGFGCIVGTLRSGRAFIRTWMMLSPNRLWFIPVLWWQCNFLYTAVLLCCATCTLHSYALRCARRQCPCVHSPRWSSALLLYVHAFCANEKRRRRKTQAGKRNIGEARNEKDKMQPVCGCNHMMRTLFFFLSCCCCCGMLATATAVYTFIETAKRLLSFACRIYYHLVKY